MFNWRLKIGMLMQNTTLRSVSNKTGVITAQARSNENEKSGFVFVYCNVTGTNETELGRPWKEKARVIFAHTYMDTVVNKEGWSDGMRGGEHKYSPRSLFPIVYKDMNS